MSTICNLCDKTRRQVKISLCHCVYSLTGTETIFKSLFDISIKKVFKRRMKDTEKYIHFIFVYISFI